MAVAAFTLRVQWRGRSWRPILWTGLLLAAGYVLQTMGLRTTTAGKSAFLTGLYIVVLPLLTSFVYKNARQGREWFGISLAAAGMAVMNWDGTQWTWGLGETLTVGCAVVFAGHLLMLDRAVREMGSQLAGLAQVAISALLFWLALPLLETPSFPSAERAGGAILLTAVLATALPFTLLAWAQKHTSPVRTGLLLALEMPFAALAGWWWLGEPLYGRMLAGAALILAGVLFVELKPDGAPEHL